MSHIMTVAACRRLGLDKPDRGAARLLDAESAGLLVRLPGWIDPACVQAELGMVVYYNDRDVWGDPAGLGRVAVGVIPSGGPAGGPAGRFA